jgi:hypothetical protein
MIRLLYRVALHFPALVRPLLLVSLLYCVLYNLFENRALFEMWKNIAQPDTPQMTVWHMRNACRIPKAANTHYVILIACQLQ